MVGFDYGTMSPSPTLARAARVPCPSLETDFGDEQALLNVTLPLRLEQLLGAGREVGKEGIEGRDEAKEQGW
jgi:hypothetical protein